MYIVVVEKKNLLQKKTHWSINARLTEWMPIENLQWLGHN